MVGIFRRFFAYLARFVFSLRYRVRAEGLRDLRGLERTLILPNHPAYIDPGLVLSAVWPVLRPRPMLFADIFRNPVLFWLPRLLRAVEIPNLEHQSVAAREQAQRTIQAVVEGLRRGENFILWPSGRVQRRNTESLGAARSLAEILAAVPEANVVAVRTRGLWGSMFSFARTGQKPPLVKTLLEGLGLLLANLIFFAPRRSVHLTLQRFAPGDLPQRTRERLNPFFEAWYNAPGPEAPTFVPYHFLLGPRTFEYPAIEGRQEVRAAEIKPEIRADVAQMIEEKLGRPLSDSEQKAEVTLESLGLDSLDRMELSIAVEGRFGFRSDEVPASVGDLWAMAAGRVEQAPPRPPPPEWFREPSGAMELRLLGETIPDAFVRQALRNARDVAVADDLSGVLTYERLLVGTRVLARQLRGLAGPNIGLMMPASVAGDVVFLAAHLAGKLPVVMNWTTGPANLAHAARTMGLTHVVTSKAFVDRTGIAIEGVQYLFLEHMRGQVGRLALLRELLAVRWRAWCGRRSIGRGAETAMVAGLGAVGAAAIVAGMAGQRAWLSAAGGVLMMAALGLVAIVRVARDLDAASAPGRHGGRPLQDGGASREPLAGASGSVGGRALQKGVEGCPADAPAAVLFTSGSEKAPKAVPLTHRNILSNLQSVLEAYELSRRDALIGFLPIFHSFGLTVTTLLPVLTGVRVVHHPDPTDASGLARKIAGYRPTVLAGTPTFVSYILDRSGPQDVKSLRIIVVGAEKCPEAVFARARELAPQATLVEGYGITECSPLVAANRLDRNRPGTIGLPLPGVQVRVVDPDTFAPRAGGEMGMLLVHGPNVFGGYITPAEGEPPPPPFVELEGRRWYVTGDLAFLDAEGFIHFCGRLKRFIKAGGEMISLPAIEQPIADRYPPGDDGPRVAVEGVELPGGGRRIVLFATLPITVAQANAILAERGLRGIMRIDEVRPIDRIPVLGTGKTDYKVLRARMTHAGGGAGG